MCCSRLWTVSSGTTSSVAISLGEAPVAIRSSTLGLVADGKQDVGAGSGEALGEREAEAVAGAGDQRELAGQVGNGDVGQGAGHGVLLAKVRSARSTSRVAAPASRMKGARIQGSPLPG
jgi:hypothetical protein